MVEILLYQKKYLPLRTEKKKTMITIEQLKDVKTRTEAQNRYLDIDAKVIQVEEEQLRTQAPGFWASASRIFIFASRIFCHRNFMFCFGGIQPWDKVGLALG